MFCPLICFVFILVPPSPPLPSRFRLYSVSRGCVSPLKTAGQPARTHTLHCVQQSPLSRVTHAYFRAPPPPPPLSCLRAELSCGGARAGTYCRHRRNSPSQKQRHPSYKRNIHDFDLVYSTTFKNTSNQEDPQAAKNTNNSVVVACCC